MNAFIVFSFWLVLMKLFIAVPRFLCYFHDFCHYMLSAAECQPISKEKMKDRLKILFCKTLFTFPCYTTKK